MIPWCEKAIWKPWKPISSFRDFVKLQKALSADWNSQEVRMLCDAAQIFDGEMNGIICVAVRNATLLEA